MPNRGGSFAAVAALLFALAGCSSGGSGPASSPSRTSTPVGPTALRPPSSGPPLSGPASPSSARASTSSRPAAGSAEAVLAGMSLRQRVGQLLMVDCPSTGVAGATVSALTDDAVGSVILDGTTTSGAAAVQAVTARLQRYAPARAGLLIATDQEGGIVQRLQGTGFDTVPSALDQATLSPATLRARARTWGTQLRHAGVNVDLAPVLDTVPGGGAANPPIGDLQREYGHTPAAVTGHGLAYAAGMSDAGIAATAKHFPGLGRVSDNTDVSTGVTDSVTTRTDPYLAPFRAAARAGVPFLMMSTAIYARLDPGTPAAFSRPIVTGLLRTGLGYRGVIISDDLGAARQVGALSPGQRAVRFVDAGGDLVLTVVAGQARAMTSALLAEAGRDPSFRAKVDAAALVVLRAKARAGLLR